MTDEVKIDWKGGIQLWIAEPSGGCSDHLEGDELIRYKRIRHPDVAACYATTRVMVRQLCGGVLGVPANELQIAVEPDGKPSLRDFGDLHFSVSHTTKHVAVALSERALGIDIEEVGRQVSVDAVAERVISPVEWKRLDRRELGPDKFLRIWVAKEAVLKCCGEGIAGNLTSCHCAWEDEKVVSAEFRGCRYTVTQLVDVHGLVGAVANREPVRGQVQVRVWQGVPT